MAFDRDLAVVFAAHAARRFPGDSAGWEMLAATGARSLRMAHEGRYPARWHLTEAHPDAAEVACRNVALNPDVRADVENADARRGSAAAPFDFVYLDPYGTPVPFVPFALAALRDFGVLGVAATDMAVLAGAAGDACQRRYGARPVRGRLGPEGGLRVLLAYLDRQAAEGGRAIEPLIAYVGSHHVRAFVRVVPIRSVGERPIATIDETSWDGPPLGRGSPWGPLWTGPLFDPTTVDELREGPGLEHPDRVRRFLAIVREEARVVAPFTYEPNELAHRLHRSEPIAPAELVARLRRAGYVAARSHVRDGAVRSDAPRAVVEAVAR